MQFAVLSLIFPALSLFLVIFFILSVGSDPSIEMCLCTPQLLSRLQKVMEARVISRFYLIVMNFSPHIVSGVCQIIKSSPTGMVFISELHLTSVCSMEGCTGSVLDVKAFLCGFKLTHRKLLV